jgi:sarcosine oxidase, subunit gamma
MPEPVQSGKPTESSRGVQIDGVTGRSLLLLKSWTPAAEPRIQVAGVELLAKVGTTVPGEPRVLCTGPSEWLLVGTKVLPWPERGRIETDCGRHGIALADVSSGLAVLAVRGAASRDVLSRGCGLDLDPRAFSCPHCARTRFAHIAVVIDAIQGPDAFELYVAESYVHYLTTWLNDAAMEFSTPSD